MSRVCQTEPSRKAAEAAASRLALAFRGHQFHICCVMATIETSDTLIGAKFDPSRTPPEVLEAEEFAEVEAPPSPLGDDEPF